MNKILDEMEQFAKEKRICIIQPQTRVFLKELCTKHKPKHILEVGTAIGYSASFMLLNSTANITCCEASKPNIKLAKENFSRLNLSERVQIIEGDCLKTLPNIKEKFDLIFLDGPKKQYREIGKLLLPLLDENGVFVADNVEFRHMVSENAPITEKRFEETVRILREFIQDFKNNEKLETQVFADIGDGLLVAKWKKEKKE